MNLIKVRIFHSKLMTQNDFTIDLTFSIGGYFIGNIFFCDIFVKIKINVITNLHLKIF